MWAVDAEYADDTATVNEHSDVALIPPVSGGYSNWILYVSMMRA